MMHGQLQLLNCCASLSDYLQVESLRLDRQYPGLLDDMRDASETCEASKHYDKLNTNIDCKNWYQTEWKLWKKLNR